MKKLLLLIWLMPIGSLAQNVSQQQLLEQLNNVRANPTAYFASKDTVFSGYEAQKDFVYNDSLSQECQKYALTLLESQRLLHSPTGDYYESISQQGNLSYVLESFLLEQGASIGETGHRDHLLNDTEQIGIGIAKGQHPEDDWRSVYYVVIRSY